MALPSLSFICTLRSQQRDHMGGRVKLTSAPNPQFLREKQAATTFISCGPALPNVMRPSVVVDWTSTCRRSVVSRPSKLPAAETRAEV